MVSTILSCNAPQHPDFAEAKKEILALDAKQRAFHFGKDARDFVHLFSKDFLSINQGKIEHPAEADSYETFNKYFNSVDFVKWDNKSNPIIRFSEDASVAYVAVDKQVILRLKNSHGKLDTTNFAWLAVYKKTPDGWKIDCVTSTNQ